MLSPKKKLARKEIKKDPMFAFYDETLTFYEQHKKQVQYALMGLVALIILIVVYVNNRKANNEKATAEFSKVMSIYDAGVSDPKQYLVAITGQPEKGIMGLKTIVENYGSSESGELARFYLASAYCHTGQYDEALKQYDAFSGSTKLLKASASAGMAVCYEAKKMYERAAVSYEDAATILADELTSPEYLSAAGRCYGLVGEREKAVALFKRIKKEYPASASAREADRYISQFSV